MLNKISNSLRTSFLLFLLVPLFTNAQRKVIQFSGLIVSGEQSFGVPYASIFVPRTTRGTLTNEIGFFSFPLLIGDTCIVRSQGFRQQKYIIPDDGRESISVILYMQADTTLLPEVEILPFPTEADFKRAFLDLKIPEGDLNRMRKNLDQGLLTRMEYNLGFDAKMNHNYFSAQQNFNTVNQNFIPNTSQLLNPFAWGKFIKSVRRGDLKRRKEEDD